MFRRRRVDENGIDEKGRDAETALRQHIAWCLDVFLNNRPDSPELITYMLSESPTFVTISEEFVGILAGDAAYNAYTEIKSYLPAWRPYISEVDQREIEKRFEDIRTQVLSAMEDPKIGEIINLVWSAERDMPAHFTSDDKTGRTQSFLVPFTDLTSDEEHGMASLAWYECRTFLGEDIRTGRITQEDNIAVLRACEDIMIGAFIAHRTGRPELSVDIINGLLLMNENSWQQDSGISAALVERNIALKCYEYSLYCGTRIANKQPVLSAIEWAEYSS